MNSRSIVAILSVVAAWYAFSFLGPCCVSVAATKQGGFATGLYDDAGRLTRVTDPNSNSTTVFYDAAWNLTRAQNALTQNTDFRYEDRDRLTRITDHLGNNMDVLYDKVGNVTRQTDANGNGANYAYDALNRATQVTNALSNTVRIYFNPVGNQTRVTNETSKNWDYLFDWRGLVTKMTQPDATTEQYFFDKNANLSRKTDGNNNSIDYLYDSLNRLTKRSFPGGGSVTAAYDDAGRRTQMEDATGTTTYAYDDVHRLTEITYPIGFGKTVSSFYDAVGNRTKMTDPDTGNTTYEFDPADRLTKLTNADAQVTTFLFDAVNRLTKQSNHNGTYATYGFDGGGRLTQLENRKSDATLLSSFSYLHDNAGNRTQAAETVGVNPSTVTYGYDAIDRLTKEKRTVTDAIWYEYLYDGAANRTKFIQRDQLGNETGNKGYAFDSANKLTLEGNLTVPGQNGNIQYLWDLNGNLTKKNIIGDGFTEYRYDYENHMTKLNDGVVLTFTYNGDGARFSRTNGANTTKLVFDPLTGIPGLDPVVTETDGGGTTSASYTQGLGLISQKRGTATSTFHFEGIGTTRQLTDSSQSATDTYTLDAWGSALSSSGTTTNSFRYVGQFGYYGDTDSGLATLGLRHYDPAVARFTTQDPALDGNPYAYAYDNPLYWLDPVGLWGIWVGRFRLGDDRPWLVFDRQVAGAGALGGWGGVKGLAKAPFRAVGGVAYTVTHPRETASGIAHVVTHPRQLGRQIVRTACNYAHSAYTDPERFGEATGGLGGDVILSVVGANVAKLSKVRILAKCPTVARTGTAQRSLTMLPSRIRGSVYLPRLKPVNLPGWRKVEIDIIHVAKRHMHGGPFTAGRDLFPQWMSERQIEQAIREAYRYAKNVQRQGDRLRLRGKGIEMWLNLKTMMIETAYPYKR
jgi:RHS repeat-associated protein